MILPVIFDNLNEEETLNEIKRLKKTINKILKVPYDYYGHEILEDGTIVYPMVCPSPETILYWDRKFLRNGINHLENDLHVKYNRTKQEQKEKELWDKLNHIKRFKFDYDWWPHPKTPTIVLTFNDNDFIVSLEYSKEEYSSFACPSLESDYVKEELLKMYKDHNEFNSFRYEKTKESFLEALYDFCFDKWNKKNINHDILDGAWFNIEIEYDNDSKVDKYDGLNSWPYGFDDLKDYIYSLAYQHLGGNYDENT